MIIGPKIASGMFFWHHDELMFSQEASTLQRGTHHPFFGRLYDDACDEGFVLVSARTGEELPFYLDETKFLDNGDIIEWRFKPVTNDRNLKDLSVVVSND